MHENIKKFSLTGEMSADNFMEQQTRFIDFVENEMRGEGYVPSIDNEPQLTRSYKPATGNFDFELTVYGVEVGKDKSWQVSGVAHGKMTMRSTQPTK